MLFRSIATSTIMVDLWKRYQKKYSYAGDITWQMAIDALVILARKVTG